MEYLDTIVGDSRITMERLEEVSCSSIDGLSVDDDSRMQYNTECIQSRTVRIDSADLKYRQMDYSLNFRD